MKLRANLCLQLFAKYSIEDGGIQRDLRAREGMKR